MKGRLICIIIIQKTGEVSKCRAESPATCPFGIVNHSIDLKEITEFADKKNERKSKLEAVEQDLSSGKDVNTHLIKAIQIITELEDKIEDLSTMILKITKH